jgi:hypothetical protein
MKRQIDKNSLGVKAWKEVIISLNKEVLLAAAWTKIILQ